MEFEGQGEKGETPPPSSLSLCPSSPSPRYVDWIQMFITPELRTQLLSQLEDIGDGDSSSSSGSDSNSKGNGDQRGIKIAVGQKPHLSRRSIPTRVPFLSQENKENKTYREWDSQYFMIDGVDMRNLGQWKDITDLFQDRLLKNWCCWPQLEYLEIQVKTDVDPDFRRQNTRSGSISKESTRRSVEVVNLMKHRIRELRRDIEVQRYDPHSDVQEGMDHSPHEIFALGPAVSQWNLVFEFSDIWKSDLETQ
ncbi:hypothetical protein BGX31_000250 [Mortierella sp. GBA43]|nr:hypothetical protein BGX31_000250 [Mortierella sp. GBA43]